VTFEIRPMIGTVAFWSASASQSNVDSLDNCPVRLPTNDDLGVFGSDNDALAVYTAAPCPNALNPRNDDNPSRPSYHWPLSS